MQDESHKKNRQHKARLPSPEIHCRTGVVVDLNNHRMKAMTGARFNDRAIYDDLSALAVDMVRLRLQVQETYERLIGICAAIDNKD